MPQGYVLNIDDSFLRKLETADSKIQKLATTSEQTKDSVIASFRAMATQGVDVFIQKLNEAQRYLTQLSATPINFNVSANSIQPVIDAINRLSQASNKTNITINGIDVIGGQANNAIDAINRLMATLGQLQNMGGMQSFNQVNTIGRQTLREMNREAKKMEKTLESLEKAIQNYGINATQLAQKLQDAREAQRKFNEIAKQQAQSDVGGLLAMQGQQKTLNELKNYANELKKTMANLDPNSKEWNKLNSVLQTTTKQINNIEKAMKGVKGRTNSLMQSLTRFRQLVSVAFSVSRIMGFVNSLVAIRGEFELQQRSLQALLQNKDEADKLWQQTVDLAVKSPFRVKELVTYTKQLAAYRVETEKLYDTTKMLADISSGLGVDMQRLILAYGQVKAANYLRGTELRQFSEAGVNILGELSEYFTNLEGRAVSVGEVFERVSKRMVAFSDVEEVFKKLTSAGGTFYRMQEIQSETLKGMISNLKDSIDLMLNDIGKSNQDNLKGMITSVKELVDNWRDLAHTLKVVIVSMSPFLATSVLLRISNTALAKSLLDIGFSSQKVSNWLIKADTGLARFATRMGASTRVARGFVGAMGGLATLGIVGIIAGIVVGISKLITKMTSASRAAKQLKKDLSEIYTQDTASLDVQIKGYENLLARLKDVNKGSKEHKEIINDINSKYGEYLGYIVDEKTSYDSLKTSIDSVNLALTRKSKLNTYEKALGKVYESTQKTIIESEKSFEKSIDGLLGKRIKGDFLRITLDDKEIDNLLGEIDKKIKETGNKLQPIDLLNIIKEMFGEQATLNGSMEEMLEILKTRGDAIIKRKEEELRIEREINGLYKEDAESARKAKIAFDELARAEQQALEQASKSPKWEQERIKRDFAIKRIDLEVQYEGLDKGVAESRKKLLNDVDATVNDINKKIEGNAKKLGEKYANLIYIGSAEAATGISNIAESTAGAWKTQQELIKQQESLKKAGTKYDEEVLENAKKSANAYAYKLKLMGREDLMQKDLNKQESKELRLLNSQISALKEAKQTYDTLRKSFGVEESTQRTAKAFEQLFKDLDISKFTMGMTFDESGIIKVLEEIPNKAGQAGKLVKEKFNAELQGGLDVDAQVLADTKLLREIENMFTGYEVSLELQKLNIPKDWAKDFFGVETFDLSDIRTKIESELQKKIGEDRRKELEKDLEKVKEMEVKAQQERLKTYLQYARDAVGDRAKIKLEEMKKLQEIEKTFTKPEQQDVKQKAIAKVKEDSQKDLNKLEWEEFQKSDTFIDLFDDLDNASSALINHSIEKLREFKDQWKDMPLEDMRAIVSKISELEEKMIDIVPIKALTTFKDEINDIIKSTTFASKEGSIFAREGKYISAFEEERKFWEDRKNAQNDEIYRLEAILNAKEEGNDASLALLGLSEDEQEIASMTTEEIREMVKEMRDMLSISQSNIDKSTRLLKLYGLQDKAWAKMLGHIGDVLSAASDLSNAFSLLNEALGKDSDGMVGAFADAGINAMQMVVNTISLVKQIQSATKAALTFGTAMKLAMGVIGWIVMAVELIANSINKIVSAKDNKLDNRIKTLTRNVEDLDRALAKLEDRIDSAFSLSSASLHTKEAIKNLQSQIYSYERMIKLEKDKKKTDTDAIRQYENAIEDLQDKQRELEKEAVSSATSGILDSTRDAARQFVDAWYEAFAETGDGLQGLKDNFKEIMLDMIQQQASMSIAGNFLNRWKAQLDKYINANDLELTTKEASNWMRSVQEELPMLNEALQNYFTAMEQAGLDLGKTSELSGLQRGIQSVTEETAQALEALLNSTRFFVADSNAKLTLLVDSFTNPESANPMLSELRSQTDLIRTIRDMFSSVIGRGDSTHSGAYLKVVM